MTPASHRARDIRRTVSPVSTTTISATHHGTPLEVLGIPPEADATGAVAACTPKSTAWPQVPRLSHGMFWMFETSTAWNTICGMSARHADGVLPCALVNCVTAVSSAAFDTSETL